MFTLQITLANYDKLGKVRPLINHFQEKFSSLYNLNCEIAIDEAMIKFQGRSSLKQYMPMKPIKRGIKVWVRADSRNGYFSLFDVYTGKKQGTVEHQLQGKCHHAYFDNFFTSYSLLSDLEKSGIYGCGTARKDRHGFPEKLMTAKFKNR